MKLKSAPALVVLFFLIHARVIFAQGSSQDYQRAGHLDQLTRNKVFDFKIEPHWFDGGNKFWYRVDGHDKREFFVVDAVNGTRHPAFDDAVAAPILAKIGDKALTAAD